jgi:hypothetical protein
VQTIFNKSASKLATLRDLLSDILLEKYGEIRSEVREPREQRSYLILG